MPGSSSWMPYAPQGVKRFDDDDDDDDDLRYNNIANHRFGYKFPRSRLF